MKVLVLVLVLLGVVSIPWFAYWHNQAYEKNYMEYRERDYNLFTTARLPVQYHEDFIDYQNRTLGNTWIIKNKYPYLTAKNDTTKYTIYN